ncbi:nitroreductase family protein [Caenimonas terrae]|uniref:Nitroreductase family protein n=1 Tax=Caenimonas terrae TaxID=696074 RepID=A0ABW0NFC8_9BURK
MTLPPDSCEPATEVIQLPPPRQQATPRREGEAHVPGQLAFETDPLPLAEVSDMLWAAWGTRRPGSWGRSAPPMGICQEVTAYVLLPDGAYRYDPQEHQMLLVSPHDLRHCAGHLQSGSYAPLDLVYAVGFCPVCADNDEEHGIAPCADVGQIVENVSRHCGDAGLASEVHGLVNRSQLVRALGLTPRQRIALVQAIGNASPRIPAA